MRQEKFNKHGQPFSKKQKKASRTMMSLRRGFQPRNGSGFNMSVPAQSEGILAMIGAALFGMKMRRKAS